MRKRSRSREYALQMLYQLDLTRATLQDVVEDFWTYHTTPEEVQTFATQLVQGTVAHREEIDRLIAAHADNWDISRMAVVDRNILRLGSFELLYLGEVPPKVCLNEAVELAKRFGDEESSKFVNGVLDTIHKTCARHPAKTGGPAEGGDRPACAPPRLASPSEAGGAGRPDHPTDPQTTSPSRST